MRIKYLFSLLLFCSALFSVQAQQAETVKTDANGVEVMDTQPTTAPQATTTISTGFVQKAPVQKNNHGLTNTIQLREFSKAPSNSQNGNGRFRSAGPVLREFSKAPQKTSGNRQ